MEQNQDNKRKHYSPEEKFRIVKEGLTTDTPVSELCKKYGINPTNYYNWQEQFFAGALAGFSKKRGPAVNRAEEEKIASLTAECGRMKDVIAEITAENVAFKKKSSASSFLTR
jgi:transposase-like protein